ncbi:MULTISPECIES: MarR family winged helix-turn-helix transcriptional regulator [Rathayibacter]|uniref:MarR family transcriptional regulator n=1 Tax=Rathayibacter festucae TaxID=110937 RepID=A0ABX6GWN0_9MICO|nr:MULTISPECIES: MarR family transcriptional regulator [Rathayibacter]TCL81667.1 DNA-binding MarR family transcriptional regulator [Rathayibacter sp. PhB192]TCM26676.1 DNA-binding MarR family transcriptional regulator [Rathayibacter sp. PhB179]MCJ1686719.1 MarR family transcriptional regulator [Rathayibacter sp. VKM Ac-2927]MCJ1701416.1 MarR family transcriptional regulator [Rathayibacter festucae]MCJ1702824.1 MarR family transcriptional regulator [Rathayibacter sp. VKM Ac-2926]
MDEVALTRPAALRHPAVPSAPGAAEVLGAMRAFRTAESAMRRRTRGSMGMGENDLLAVQFLMRRQQGGQHVSPKDLAAYLGISSASTTVLIDRLVKSGHVLRQPHPSDRRAIRIVATPTSHREVRETLDDMNQRMLAAAEQLSPEEASAVVRFLQTVREIVEIPGEQGDVLEDDADHELTVERRRA